MREKLVLHKKYVINTNAQYRAFIKILEKDRRLWSITTLDEGDEYFMIVRTYNRAKPFRPMQGGPNLGRP